MSTLVDLLEYLAQRDVTLSLDGAEIHFRAPKGVMTAELRASIRQHRDTLIRLLTLREYEALGAQLDSLNDAQAPDAGTAPLYRRYFALSRQLAEWSDATWVEMEQRGLAA